MPSACAPTVGPGALEGRHRRRLPPTALPSRARASRSSSFSLPPSRQRAGDAARRRGRPRRCARRGCRASCNFWPCDQALGARAGRRSGLAAGAAARGRPTAMTTWTSAMPPLVAHAFGAVEHPLVVGLVVHGAACACAPTSEPASGSEAQNAPSLSVVRRAEALRAPTRPICSGGAVAGDRRRRRARCPRSTGRCRRRPRTAPRWRSGSVSPVGSTSTGRHEVEASRGRSWRPPG